MMGAARLCARRELRRARRAHLAIAVLVAVGGGTVLAVTAGAHRTDTAFDRFLAYSGVPDTFALVGGDEAQLDQVRHLPQVDRFAGLRLYAMNTPDPSVYVPIAASIDGQLGDHLLRPLVLEGRRADLDEPHEVSLNENQARLLGVDVGDTVQLPSYAPTQMDALQAGDREVTPNGPVVRLEVVGITRNAGEVATAADDPGILLLTPAFDRAYRDRIGSFVGFLFAASLQGGERAVDPFTAAVRDIYRDDAAPQFQPLAVADAAVRSSLRVLTVGLLLFAAAAATAGLVALAVTIARQVTGDADDDAVRRDLGMTRSERVAALALPHGVVAAVGAAGAVVLAAGASARFPFGLGRRAEPDPGVSLDLPVLGIGGVVVALTVAAVAVLVSWRLIARSGRATEVDLRTNRSRSLTGLAIALGLGPAAVTGVRMATEPGRGRTAVPVRPAMVGASVGVAGLVAALLFGSTLSQLVHSPERWGWNWDVAVVDTPPVRAALENHGDEVDAVAVGSFVKLVIGGHAVDSIAFDPVRGSVRPTVIEGREPQGPDEVALGGDTLARRSLTIGDTVTADGPSGPTTLHIVGRAVFPTVDDRVSLADGAALTPAGMQRLDDPTDSEGYQQLVVRWAPGADTSRAGAWLARAAGEEPTTARLPGEIHRLTQVDRLPGLLAAFLVVLALLAVANSAMVVGRRRRRDLGVLGSIGFTGRQIRSTLGWQATTLAAIGLIVGIPAGIIVGRLAWAATAGGLGVADDIVVPVAQLLGAALLTLLLLATVGLIAGARVGRRHPALALRAE